jgi:hypothetical protein
MLLILRVVLALLPGFWFGWSAKGLGEWYRPDRLSYASSSGSFASLLLWSGIAAGILAVIRVLYPDKSLLGGFFQALRDFWGWILAQWETTNPPAA